MNWNIIFAFGTSMKRRAATTLLAVIADIWSCATSAEMAVSRPDSTNSQSRLIVNYFFSPPKTLFLLSRRIMNEVRELVDERKWDRIFIVFFQFLIECFSYCLVHCVGFGLLFASFLLKPKGEWKKCPNRSDSDSTFFHHSKVFTFNLWNDICIWPHQKRCWNIYSRLQSVWINKQAEEETAK